MSAADDDRRQQSRPPARAASGGTTSRTLLERIRSHDADAWTRLVQLYRPLVYYWCGQTGCSRGDWDDVVQEVFLAVAKSLPNFRRDRPGDTFRGWLRGITRHTLLTYFRRVGRQPQAAGGSEAMLKLGEVAQSEDPEQPDPPVEVNALQQRALEMVKGEFEPKTWQMFWLAAIDNRPPADIAAELGVSTGAVRMAKSRVLRRLKEEFEDLLG